MISKSEPTQQRNNQPRTERPVRQVTQINMTLSQILPQLLKTNLVTLKEAPKNRNTTSLRYNPNARCAYHSESPGHNTNNCWALKNKVQDLIEAKEIEFDPPETPNVITAPMPKHDSEINVVEVISSAEDANNDDDMDRWIFPTTNGGISNWIERYFVPITFV